MGIKISLSETFTDKSAPKLFDAPYMDIGTIWMFDPSHSMGAITGVPANAAAIPNVARNQAASILGVADATTLNGSFDFVRESAATLALERTAKGGLHICPSQSAMTTTGNRAVIRAPSAIKQYILDRIPAVAAGFYVSVWSITTRAQITTGAPISPLHFSNSATATSNYLWHMQGLAPSAGGSLGTVNAANTVGAACLDALGCSAWVGTKPTTLAMTTFALGGAGCFDGWMSLNQNKSSSLVIYKVKIEDLALCKRSNNDLGGTLAEEYAAAYAADLAEFTAAFAVGGRFYGDTWTDPATLCP